MKKYITKISKFNRDKNIENYLKIVNNKLSNYGLGIYKYLNYQLKNFNNHYENIYNLNNGINSKFCLDKDTANTTDAIIYSFHNQEFYVAVIKRKHAPDKNTYSLPGGLIDLNEKPSDACIREAMEETGLKDFNNIIELGLVENTLLWDTRFTKPISIWGYAINVKFNELLKLKASDDANEVLIFKFKDLVCEDMSFLHSYWLLKFLDFKFVSGVSIQKIKDKIKFKQYLILCDKLLSNEIRKNLNNKNLNNPDFLFEEFYNNKIKKQRW